MSLKVRGREVRDSKCEVNFTPVGSFFVTSFEYGGDHMVKNADKL